MLSTIVSTERYEIVNKIAEGGMGAVFKAKILGAAGFEKIVALKTLLPKYSEDTLLVRNFISEAKLSANLIHPNIVQIYQLNKSSEGYFFVLEFVDGISLFELVEFHNKIHQRLPVGLAVFIAAMAARGLAYAHGRKDEHGQSLGIVHCDVCPRNIMIDSEGVPKITDFGIARVYRSRRFEEHRKISGKLSFMSPEQGLRLPVDYRSDIFSLGLVLFYMLSGKILRDLTLETNMLLALISRNEIDWSHLPEDLAPELRTMLEKMLSTEPVDRYSDTAALAEELENFIYKDIHGPTNAKLAEYMREVMPGRFCPDTDGVIGNTEKTLVLKR